MIIQLIIRVLHIAATCTSLGGLFYSRMVLVPNLIHVPSEHREKYLAKMIKRFSVIKWIGVGVVAITGLIQWFQIFPIVGNQQAYILAFGLKMLGAFGLFTITFLLALPNEKLAKMKQSRAFWSAINILCGLTIIIGAALMRSIRLT